MCASRETSGRRKRGLIRLDQTFQISSERAVSSTYGLLGGKVDLDAITGRRTETRVDRKKLEKAELKIRAKLDKRIMKANYEASRLLDEQDKYEEEFLQVNPLQLGNNLQKSKDIKLDGIDLFFSGNRLLTDSSLTLAYGRRYGLVGNNGVGKSTLLRALSRRELPVPTHVTILHVEQEVIGDDTTALQSVLDADVWRKICLIEQDKIMARLAELDKDEKLLATESKPISSKTALERERLELDERLKDIHDKLTELDADSAEPRAGSILAGLGFSKEDQMKATKTFSGGWRMRLALARALFCRPDLLLLDEPSNMLDVPSVTFLANYLQNYPSTVLVVSHDRDFLDEVATDIVYQHNERLDYFKGNFSAFQSTKEERRKTQQREYDSQMAYRKHVQEFIDKFRYNANKAAEAQSRIKKLERLPKLDPPETESATHFRFYDPEKIPSPMLQMTGVSFGYSDKKRILENVDIDVQLDSRIGIIGQNGTGKTTLLKLLIGDLDPQGGLVTRHPRLRIGYFAQHHIDGLDMSMNAVSFLASKFPGYQDEEYRRALGSFGITGLTGLQQMSTLSGGQKSRVAFAALAMRRPHILVLDEPTNHLDITGMDALIDAIGAFGGGVVLVSHDVRFLSSTCNELWLCDSTTKGVKKFNGTIKEYQKHVMSMADNKGLIL